MPSLYDNVENSFSKNPSGQATDRTFLEKIFGKEEMQQIKAVMEKESLSETNICALESMINSWELKLVNHGDKSRYACGKYTTWISDFNSINILITAMIEMEKDNNIGEGMDALKQAKKIADLCTKRLINNYLYFARSGLSLGGFAFNRVTTQRIEQEYTTRWPEFGQKDKNVTYNLRGGKQ